MVGEGTWKPEYSDECYQDMKKVAQVVNKRLDELGVVKDRERAVRRNQEARKLADEMGLAFDMEAFGMAYGGLVIERRHPA